MKAEHPRPSPDADPRLADPFHHRIIPFGVLGFRTQSDALDRNIPRLEAITWQGKQEYAINAADERSRSCWIEDAPAIEASPLQRDQVLNGPAVKALAEI